MCKGVFCAVLVPNLHLIGTIKTNFTLFYNELFGLYLKLHPLVSEYILKLVIVIVIGKLREVTICQIILIHYITWIYELVIFNE